MAHLRPAVLQFVAPSCPHYIVEPNVGASDKPKKLLMRILAAGKSFEGNGCSSRGISSYEYLVISSQLDDARQGASHEVTVAVTGALVRHGGEWLR